MELRVDMQKPKVEQLLAGVPEVETVKEIKGGSLIVTRPVMEVVPVRGEIERRVGPTVWFAD